MKREKKNKMIWEYHKTNVLKLIKDFENIQLQMISLKNINIDTLYFVNLIFHELHFGFNVSEAE